jgi:cystine transport system substrate-binding protein
VLGLYALDSQLSSARARLAALERQADRLRDRQAQLATQRKIAVDGARLSQQRLASWVRLLFARGETSEIEILLGARSLEDALTGLDNLEDVTSVNADVLDQLRAAKLQIARTSKALATHAAKLAEATRAQAATTRALSAARAERAAYIADLQKRRQLNSLQISQIESQARAAGATTKRLVASVGTSAPAAGLTAVSGNGRTLTVSAVAYSLPGHTASGLPVGWGIVAVDPTVIPLGTRMVVPGYGPAVAADTGTAIKGAIIDLWFPTLEMAQAWGRRSVTITLN